MYELALILSIVAWLGVAFFFLRSPVFSLFHPLTIYLAFHGVVFVFRPVLAYFLNYEQIYRSYGFSPSPQDKLTVILASNLGFLVFAFFALRAGNVAMSFLKSVDLELERERLKPVFLWVLLSCAPLGIYSLSQVWTGAALTGLGYEGMIRDAATGIYVNTTANGYLVEAQLMLASLGAIIAWLFRFRLIALLPLIGFVVFKAGTGGRGPFITALASVGLLYLYEHRRRFPPLKVALLLAALIPVFNAVGADRGASIRRVLGAETSSEVFTRHRDDEKFMEGMDFANMEYFEYIVYAVPQRSGTYGYFLDTLQIFTEPVPRVLWPGKPIGDPFKRIALFDYGSPIGMTRSLPGQGWFSLGWLGVVVWCGFWGWLLGTIYRRYVLGRQSTFQTLAYMLFLPILIIAYRDGQLITILRQGLFFLGPIGLCYVYARLLGIASIDELRNRTKAASAKPRRSSAPALPPAVLRRRAVLAQSRGRDE